MDATGVGALKTLVAAFVPVPTQAPQSPKPLGLLPSLAGLVLAVLHALRDGARGDAENMDGLLMSGHGDVEPLAGGEGVRDDVDAGVGGEVNWCTGATVRERRGLWTVQAVGLVQDAQMLSVADSATAGSAALGGRGRNGVGRGPRENGVGGGGCLGGRGQGRRGGDCLGRRGGSLRRRGGSLGRRGGGSLGSRRGGVEPRRRSDGLAQAQEHEKANGRGAGPESERRGDLGCWAEVGGNRSWRHVSATGRARGRWSDGEVQRRSQEGGLGQDDRANMRAAKGIADEKQERVSTRWRRTAKGMERNDTWRGVDVERSNTTGKRTTGITCPAHAEHANPGAPNAAKLLADPHLLVVFHLSSVDFALDGRDLDAELILSAALLEVRGVKDGLQSVETRKGFAVLPMADLHAGVMRRHRQRRALHPFSPVRYIEIRLNADVRRTSSNDILDGVGHGMGGEIRGADAVKLTKAGRSREESPAASRRNLVRA
ncbi:hypothetical protein DFH06DRAFT_1141269 [Mycena polygramma]|nr:hypothetical protein DFH06DRAFT_1141269 [Mycena polygramma]